MGTVVEWEWQGDGGVCSFMVRRMSMVEDGKGKEMCFLDKLVCG